jgi:hypothetical protein
MARGTLLEENRFRIGNRLQGKDRPEINTRPRNRPGREPDEQSYGRGNSYRNSPKRGD